MSSAMNMKRSVAAPLGQRRRAGLVVRARAATETLVAHRPTTAAQPSPASAKVTSSRDEVLAMHARLAAKSKALISLEEMQAANRPMARIILKKKVGLGEVWKLTGSCPELGNMNPQVAPAMQWTAGDVWVLETRIREGSHTFKAVLRRGDGAYIWEAGQDRTLNVSGDLGKDDKITLELDVKMPY